MSDGRRIPISLIAPGTVNREDVADGAVPGVSPQRPIRAPKPGCEGQGLTNGAQPPQEGKPAKRKGAAMSIGKRSPGILDKAIRAIFGPPAQIDLCDFPLLLKDVEALATFFQECSAEFPGSRRICLPSAMADTVMASPPPTREALRLIKTLRPGHRVVLSNRLLPEEIRRKLTLESILFV